jgi:hypothetical protein
MISTHRVEMSSIIGVKVLEPHHAGDAIDAVGNLGWLVATELFATSNHGYNSREHAVSGGESERHCLSKQPAKLASVHGLASMAQTVAAIMPKI